MHPIIIMTHKEQQPSNEGHTPIVPDPEDRIPSNAQSLEEQAREYRLAQARKLIRLFNQSRSDR